MLTKIQLNIYALNNFDPPPLFKMGQQILLTSPGEGNSEKLKKGVEAWCRGKSSLKRGTGTFPI